MVVCWGARACPGQLDKVGHPTALVVCPSPNIYIYRLHFSPLFECLQSLLARYHIYNMYLCVKINAAIPVYKAIRKSYSNSPHNSKNNSGLPNP